MEATGLAKVVPRCSICGLEDPNLEGLGPIVFVGTSSYRELQSLFAGDLDEYVCPAEHKTPGLRPTIFVQLENEESLLAWGSMAVGRKAQQDFFVRETGDAITTVDDPDQLRLSVAHYAAEQLQEVIAGANRLAGSESAGMRKEWEQFSSGYFACSVLMLTTPLPGTEIRLPPDVTMEDVFKAVVNLQVATWIGLCGSWAGDVKTDRSLEGELSRFLAPDSVIHTAADEFLRVTEDISQWTPIGQFCVEAVRATLCQLRGQANLHLREWAKLLVEQEIFRHMAGDEAPPLMRAMEVSAERIRNTIPYQSLFNACAGVFAEAGAASGSAIDALGLKAGYPNLAAQLAASLKIVTEGNQKITVKQVVSGLTASSAGRVPEAVWLAASRFLDILAEEVTPASLTAIADGLMASRGDSPEERALAEQWLSSELLSRRFVKAALDRLGSEARSWETGLPADLRARLETERSNALRAAGRRVEAIASAEASIEMLAKAGFEPSPEARRNLGILYQETGRQQKALEIFFEQLKNADPDLRLRLLFSIAATYSSVGRYAESLPYLEEAVTLASGPHAGSRPKALTLLAAAKSVTGSRKEALTLLREVPSEACSEALILIPYASTWVNATQEEGLLEAADRKRLSEVVGLLHDTSRKSLEAGDMQVHVAATRLLAITADLANIAGQDVFWNLLNHSSRSFEGAPDPMALVALARTAWAEGNPERGKSLLAELPGAVAARYGAEPDPTLKLDALRTLGRYFNQIGGLVIRGNSLDDVRIVAEAQRDLLGRLTMQRAGALMLDRPPVVPDAVTVAQLRGPCAVLEWLDSTDGVIGLVTSVSVEGHVTVSDLEDPGVDLDALAEKIAYRVSTWHEDRSGDPFDLPAWKTFEAWLQEMLQDRLPDGGQLVVIEHPEVWGLQWHVAAAPRWRTSYLPSWTALLDSPARLAGNSSGPVGVAMVAKFRDSQQVLEPLERSVEHTRSLAAQTNRRVELRMQNDCDRKALIELFETSDVVKLLCHGYIDPEDRQVALSIAVDGEQPLADSAAAGTPAGRRHRFGWQECQTLNKAPAVVFSAACSSGRAHPAGLGERLGFYRVLHRSGTASFIAPRWDIKPSAVLPILDDTMARQLLHGEPVGEALHRACLNASAHQPRWIAWALAMEGDWK